jgi:hypothetical protein
VTGRARQRDSAPIPSGEPGTAVGATRRRRPIAFGIHQLLEYLLAVALVVVSVHIGRSHLLLIGGVIFGLLALTARGPLGIIRLCGMRLHAVLDVTAAVFLAAAPLVGALRPGIAGLVAIEVVAVAWLRVTMLTRYSSRARAGSGDGAVHPTASTADVAGPDGAESPPGSVLSAIRGLGRMTAGARTRLPETKVTLDAGARRMGTQAGRLQRAWRRAAR